MAARFHIFRRRDAARARSGSAALEFAFVAPVFFAILFGIIEGGIMFFSQTALQSAVTDAARLIRTGQAQTSTVPMDAATFRQKICTGIAALLACDSNLQIDVESYPSGFTSTAPSSPVTNTGTVNAALDNYSLGNPCDVVIVRAFYTWQVFTPLLTPFLVSRYTPAASPGNSNPGSVQVPGNYHLLSAAAAVRNEPYTNQVAGC